MRRFAATVTAALACGVGIGVGQGLMGVRDIPSAWAQASAAQRGSDELTVIGVVRQARPAVVSVKHGSVSGSGVIIRPDGVILTNAHVVGDKKQVEVRLASGKKLMASVQGVDPTVDVAVVKVNEKELPVAPLADSDDLQVGQKAIAIGNPMGLDGTVTTGVISATDRQRGPDDFVGFIQTDAAINPGNSGGPLLDSQGRVVGINTWIMSRATGLGFAVPINVARDVVKQVLETGHVRRAVLGLVPVSVTREVAQKMSLPVSEGAAVAELSADSPAAKAGVKADDIITQVDNEVIHTAGDLRRVLRARKPGDTVTLKLRRGGESPTVRVSLGEATS
jgi:serine protease Do